MKLLFVFFIGFSALVSQAADSAPTAAERQVCQEIALKYAFHYVCGNDEKVRLINDYQKEIHQCVKRTRPNVSHESTFDCIEPTIVRRFRLFSREIDRCFDYMELMATDKAYSMFRCTRDERLLFIGQNVLAFDRCVTTFEKTNHKELKEKGCFDPKVLKFFNHDFPLAQACANLEVSFKNCGNGNLGIPSHYMLETTAWFFKKCYIIDSPSNGQNF